MKEIAAVNFFLQLLYIVLKRKKMILSLVFVSTLASIIFVMMIKKTYEAVAVVKPPKDSKSMSSFMQNMASGSFGDLFGGLMGSETGENDCISILGSAQFARMVIAKFDLARVYKFKPESKKYYLANVIKEFHSKATFAVNDEDAIVIAIRDKSSERAKEIVDYMVFLLDSLYFEVQNSLMVQNLNYIDSRVAMSLKEMKAVEDTLTEYQKAHKLYLPEKQIEASLRSLARFETKVAVLEERMRLESALRGAETPMYKKLAIELAELKRQLRTKITDEENELGLNIPVKAIPDMVMDFWQIQRNHSIKQAVFKFLVQQAEALKLEVGKSINQIAIIDPAWVNNKKVSPPRRVIVQVVFITSIILSCLLAVLLELWGKHKTENSDTFQLVKKVIQEMRFRRKA